MGFLFFGDVSMWLFPASGGEKPLNQKFLIPSLYAQRYLIYHIIFTPEIQCKQLIFW